MSVSLCFSSQLTSKVLTFRNPLGNEDHRIDQAETRGNYARFGLKVITTEIVCSLLVLVSTVETVIYAIFTGLSLLAWPISPSLTHARYFSKQLSSSYFTIFWNLGNVMVFNPFCIHCVTNESFARYTIDNWDRGFAFKLFLMTSILALEVLTNSTVLSLAAVPLSQVSFTRREDILYLRYTVPGATHQTRELGPSSSENQGLRYIRNYGEDTNHCIQEGANFIKDYFFAEGQMERETCEMIKAYDPDVSLLMLTRAIFLFVFGPYCNKPIPDFFKRETQNGIQQMRNKYASDPIQLDDQMREIAVFEQEPEGEMNQKVFRELKQIAYGEQQDGLFFTRCYQLACRE